MSIATLRSLSSVAVRAEADAAHAAAVAAVNAGESRVVVERHTRVWDRALRVLEERA